MTASATKYLSLEEYFDFEYKAKIRHEYLDGKLRPMSYTSPNHGLIVSNLSWRFNAHFRNMDGSVWTETRMVYAPDCNRIYYPDVVIVSGAPAYFDYKGKMEATLNPVALIEISSDSTEENDKTEKWQCYQSISSLQQYVLISQKSAFVELYQRQEAPSNQWIYTGHSDFKDVLPIAGCAITLQDIYPKVSFPARNPATESEENL